MPSSQSENDFTLIAFQTSVPAMRLPSSCAIRTDPPAILPHCLSSLCPTTNSDSQCTPPVCDVFWPFPGPHRLPIGLVQTNRRSAFEISFFGAQLFYCPFCSTISVIYLPPCASVRLFLTFFSPCRPRVGRCPTVGCTPGRPDPLPLSPRPTLCPRTPPLPLTHLRPRDLYFKNVQTSYLQGEMHMEKN